MKAESVLALHIVLIAFCLNLSNAAAVDIWPRFKELRAISEKRTMNAELLEQLQTALARKDPRTHPLLFRRCIFSPVQCVVPEAESGLAYKLQFR
uniref:Uncharacterized protein n=1 Tax=Plectus sambesii TaxID=2011161 RepID=A0A914WH16_9BILA